RGRDRPDGIGRACHDGVASGTRVHAYRRDMEPDGSEDGQDLAWAPSACTLPTVERPLRVSEFDAFFAGAVRRVARPERTRLRWELDECAEAPCCPVPFTE